MTEISVFSVLPGYPQVRQFNLDSTGTSTNKIVTELAEKNQNNQKSRYNTGTGINKIVTGLAEKNQNIQKSRY